MKSNNNICKFINFEKQYGINTYNFVYEQIAANSTDFKTSDYYIIYFVIDGEGELITKTQKFSLVKGDVFFSFKQIPFKINNTKAIKYMYISFDGYRVDELFSRFSISPINCVYEGYSKLAAFWENSIVKANKKNLDLISESVLLYTLSEISPKELGAKQHAINEIILFIEENFKDNTLNLDTVAKHFGYNSKYISRIFKENMGTTFSSYLTNIRLNHAVFLIEQQVTLIKNIAFLCGFSDPLYFSSVFKSRLGVSPKQYIAQMEKETEN